MRKVEIKKFQLLIKGIERTSDTSFRITRPLFLSSNREFLFEETRFENNKPINESFYGIGTHQGTRCYFEKGAIPLGFNSDNEFRVSIQRDGQEIICLGKYEDKKLRVKSIYWPGTEVVSNVAAASDGGHLVLSNQISICVLDRIFDTTILLQDPLFVSDCSSQGIAIGGLKIPEDSEIREKFDIPKDQLAIAPCYWNLRGEPGVLLGPDDGMLDPSCIAALEGSDAHAIVGQFTDLFDRTRGVLHIATEAQINSREPISPVSLSERVRGDAVILDAVRVTSKGVILGEADFGDGAKRALIIPRSNPKLSF